MANRYWVGGTGNWSDTARWATTTGGAGGASVPGAADNAFFDANSGTGTATTTTGATCIIVTLNSSTLSLVLGDNFTHTGRFNFTLGSLSLGTYTWTCNDLQTSNTNVRSLDFGTGKIVLTGSGATIFSSNPTNLTLSGSKLIEAAYAGAAGTRAFSTGLPTEANTINLSITAGTDIVQTNTGDGRIGNLNLTGFGGTFSNTSSKLIYGDFIVGSGVTLGAGSAAITFSATSGTKTITTAGKTFDFPLVFNGVGGAWAFSDALTQGSTRAFTLTNGTVQLKDGATSTVGNFVATSTSQKFLQSTLTGTQATLSQAAGTVSVSDLNIRDINAVGGASWNAYTDFENTDAGNNDGWNFSLSPPYASYEPPIIIRSFTQPRRF